MLTNVRSLSLYRYPNPAAHQAFQIAHVQEFTLSVEELATLKKAANIENGEMDAAGNVLVKDLPPALMPFIQVLRMHPGYVIVKDEQIWLTPTFISQLYQFSVAFINAPADATKVLSARLRHSSTGRTIDIGNPNLDSNEFRRQVIRGLSEIEKFPIHIPY